MASKKNIRQRKQIINPNTEKISIIIGLIVTIAFIVFTFYQNTTNVNYNNIKQDKGAYLVYTKYSDQSTKYTKEVPFVNLKAEVFKEVNKDILLFCGEYIDKEKSVISYEYDVNGIILSLVIKVINNETIYAPEPYFRSYNINLETQEVISDEALLQFYGVTETSVKHKIKRQFQSFYSDIVQEKYFDSSECSFDCFLKWRGVSNYLDHLSYYVRDGKLIAFKSFVAHSIFGEEEYFTDESFEFKIAEAPVDSHTELPLSSN